MARLPNFLVIIRSEKLSGKGQGRGAKKRTFRFGKKNVSFPKVETFRFADYRWRREEINGIEFELNSIIVEKWKGKPYRLVIQRQRRTDNLQEIWEGEYTYRCILTNDFESDVRDIVEFYNLRGGKERIFDDMNNGFGWKLLPKSFLSENTVYLLMIALIRNFYKMIIKRINVKDFGLSHTSRIKAFVFKYISVAAKWVKTAGTYRLNIYTGNFAYARVFKVGTD